MFMQYLHKLKAHRDGHTFSPIPVNVQTPMPLNIFKCHFYTGSTLKGGLTHPAVHEIQFKQLAASFRAHVTMLQ